MKIKDYTNFMIDDPRIHGNPLDIGREEEEALPLGYKRVEFKKSNGETVSFLAKNKVFDVRPDTFWCPQRVR